MTNYCENCFWNDDCLCDKYGVLVTDEDWCDKWEATEEKNLSES